MKEKFTKKFIFWQVLILLAIGLFIYFNYKQWAIVFGIIELAILYGHFRRQEENQYILPSGVAKKLKVIDQKTIYEGDILSKVLLMIFMVLTTGYAVIFGSMSWWYKAFIAIDILAGVAFFFFGLVTTYQQYVTYMNTIKMFEQNPPINYKEVQNATE